MASPAEDKIQTSVELSVIHFVDRAIESERKLTTSERERIMESLTDKLKCLEEKFAENFISIEAARKTAFATIDEQKKKDDTEYQRRLGELNHEKERIAAAQGLAVSRDLFEARNKEVDIWKTGVDKTLANQAGRTATWIIVGWLFFAVAGIAFHFWK